MEPRIKAIYLAIEDMDRAVKFYEEIFNISVSAYGEKMSSFDLGNISFLLFNPAFDDEDVIYGNNVVLNIEIDDIDKMFDFVKNEGCEIVMHPELIGEYLIFQVKDTEGNIIEFYKKN